MHASTTRHSSAVYVGHVVVGSDLSTGFSLASNVAAVHRRDEITGLFMFFVVGPVVLFLALVVAGLICGAITSSLTRSVPDGKRPLVIAGSSLMPAVVAFMIACAVIADSALATARGTNDGRAPVAAGFFLFELPDGGVKLWRDYDGEAQGEGRTDNMIATRLVSVGQSSHYVYGQGAEGFFLWDTGVPRTSFAVKSSEDLERAAKTANIALSLQDPRALYEARRRIWIDIAGWVASFVVIAGTIAAWVRFVRKLATAPDRASS